MNISEAKQIRLVEYLRILGYSPSNVRGCQYWYLSPLREERTPSFKVNDSLNEWYDFALSDGGDIIELGKYLYHTGNVNTVLQRISESVTGVSFRQLQSRTVRPCPVENEMENIEVRELGHYALLSYLRSRHISAETGRRYCKEIHYDLRKRHYFALAFENDSGGYEVRNPYFKGCINGKDITLVRHDKNLVQSQVCVFEGFMDFLSYRELQEKRDCHVCMDSLSDFLVMNSVSNLKKCLAWLERYASIHCYLDNDLAGEKTAETIAGLYGSRVTDHSVSYYNYKDLNDYLRGKRR